MSGNWKSIMKAENADLLSRLEKAEARAKEYEKLYGEMLESFEITNNALGIAQAQLKEADWIINNIPSRPFPRHEPPILWQGRRDAWLEKRRKDHALTSSPPPAPVPPSTQT